MAKITTIKISSKTWKELKDRKELGETFDDVLIRMMLETPKTKGKSKYIFTPL